MRKFAAEVNAETLPLRCGHSPEEYKDFPFRVLLVLQNEERRNNLAERLLKNNPPVRTMAWLTTFAEITTDPLGAIWVQPADYMEIVRDTAWDPRRERTGAYRRDPAREAMAATAVEKAKIT